MIRPLYKAQAPFMETPSGFGYQGVVMYDDDKDKVQCSACGEWFSNVGNHQRAHKTTADEYRISNGLNLNIALCSRALSKTRSVAMSNRFINHKRSRPKKKKYQRYAPPRQIGTKVMSQQNKFGLCELQMKSRYEVVKIIVGKVPTEAELREHDHALYSAIERRYKTLNKFRVSVGDKPMSRQDGRRVDDLDIIAALRKMASKFKRAPKIRDFTGGAKPHYSTILERFGGWSTALRIAGIGESEGYNKLG